MFDMTIKSPCAVKIALGGNPKNTYGDQRRLPMTRMGIAKVLDDTFAKAKKYMEEGHFAPGSMLPKVQAAVDFASSKGRPYSSDHTSGEIQRRYPGQNRNKIHL